MDPDLLRNAFEEHQRTLWGLGYRVTGLATDADEIVQETFLRLAERPPKDLDRSLRPWLVQVALNLARDRLRRRRRLSYPGVWLPEPVDGEAPPVELGDAETRYGQRESATLAFLLALETLTPQQRAVLLMRDAFGASTEETAQRLGIGSSNVKMTLQRARRRLASVERGPLDPSAHVEALGRLALALSAEDPLLLEQLFTEDVVSLSDGAGEVAAARMPVVGTRKVAALYRRLNSFTQGHSSRWEVRVVNGLPTILLEVEDPPPAISPRVMLTLDLGSDGRIRRMLSVPAPSKLGAIAPISRWCSCLDVSRPASCGQGEHDGDIVGGLHKGARVGDPL